MSGQSGRVEGRPGRPSAWPDVAAAILAEPERWWTVRELAAATNWGTNACWRHLRWLWRKGKMTREALDGSGRAYAYRLVERA